MPPLDVTVSANHVPLSPGVANMIQVLDADTALIRPNMGFIPGDTGLVRIQGRVDAAYSDVPVENGVYVPIDIKAFDQASSNPNTIALAVLRQGA